MTQHRIYEALLRNDRIEWLGEAPAARGALRVRVSVVDDDAAATGESDGAAMARALQRLADAGGLTAINDPVHWQREVRADRPLPGRE